MMELTGLGGGARCAVVMATRLYGNEPVAAILRSFGLKAIRVPYHAGAAAALARLDPVLTLLIIRPGREDERRIIKELRRVSREAIVVLAVDDLHDGALECLRDGADAVIDESDGVEHLEAQIEAILRRAPRQSSGSAAPDGVIRVDELEVDCKRCEVRLADMTMYFTPVEFRILRTLAEHAGQVLSPIEIVEAVQPEPYTPYQARDTVKVYIRTIRKKLAIACPGKEFIVNVRGFGYMLDRCDVREDALATNSSIMHERVVGAR